MSEKFMINSEGHHVPYDKVKPEDKLEDVTVNTLYRKAADLNVALAAFKELAFSDVNTFLELLGEKYGVKKGGGKGNVTLTSYDGLTRVQVSIADFIDFGPQLQIAKQLIDECINSWSNGANENLKIMIDHAFRVDKNNRINTTAILGLRRHDIRDEKWKQAMQAIDESIRVTRSKSYIRFYHRDSTDQPWKSVLLDLASV